MDQPEPIAYESFTVTCQVCGGTIAYDKGRVQRHRCRIDLDAQRGR